MARLKAEADAENATRRLAVAQEQIAEYAQARHDCPLLAGMQPVHPLSSNCLRSTKCWSGLHLIGHVWEKAHSPVTWDGPFPSRANLGHVGCVYQVYLTSC